MSSSKFVLCYGDSNTWGYVPGTDAERYPPAVRWPGILRSNLGDDWHVYENGLNGRTTVFEDPMKPGRNGSASLPECLEVNAPLHWIILALGVNDLKHYLHLEACDIAQGARRLVEQIRAANHVPALLRQPPKILLLSPIAPSAAVSQLGRRFDNAPEKATSLAMEFHRIAEELDCDFLDTNHFAKPSPIDGIHLDEQSHHQLGTAVAKELLKAG